jgi:hypothetical protein
LGEKEAAGRGQILEAFLPLNWTYRESDFHQPVD